MDTRKYLNDLLAAHRSGKTIMDLYPDDVEREDLQALMEKARSENDLLACEWTWLNEIQYYFENPEWWSEDASELLEKLEPFINLSLRNGSKLAGFLKYLEGKSLNDQSLIDQYAQYASVEQEFEYCKSPEAPEVRLLNPDETRKYLDDLLAAHRSGKTIMDLYPDDVEREDLQALMEKARSENDLSACEWTWLNEIQYYFENPEWWSEDASELLEKLEPFINLSLRNGSKLAGFLKYLEGKSLNDQSLIDQYAQYASVEQEFEYCKSQISPTPAPAATPPAPASSTPYHLGVGKERLGEHTLEQIKQKIEQGTLNPLTKGWQQGWPEWKVISEIPEIASLMAHQPPPLPDDGPPPL